MQKSFIQQLCGAGSLAVSLAAHAAHAQDVSASPDTGTYFDRGRTVAVAERVQPGFEEIGFTAGGFQILPRVEVAGFADDNLYAGNDERKGDVGLLLAPSARVRSNWSRHQLGLSASSVITRYAQRTSENAETFAIRAQGRYDADTHWRIYGTAGFRRDIERRSDPGALRDAARPVRYDTLSGGGRVTWQGTSVRVAAEGNYTRVSYQDVRTASGEVLDSRYLGRRLSQASLRADYAVSPNLALVAIGNLTWIDYPNLRSLDSVDRSSRKTELLAGVSFEFTDVLRGEVTAGYISQHYQDARIRDFSGFGGRAQWEYFPTRLTTVRFGVSRTQREAGNPLAPSYRRARAELQVDHELFRTVVVSGFADYESDRFQLPQRTERRAHLGLSGQYLVDRHVTLFARYDYLRVSTAPANIGRRLTENTVLAGILIKP